MQVADTRGLPCPEPAMMAMETIKSMPNETFQILVSSATPKTNVTELAQRQGCTVTAERVGNDYTLIIA